MSAPDRILVRLPNWLGDVLLARPLLHAIATRNGAEAVTAWGPPPLLALLEPDRVWRDAEPWSAEGAERMATVARLQALRWGWAVVLPPSFSSAWWAMRAGARRRAGFSGDARRWLLTHAVPRPARGDRHLSDEYLELGRVAGLAAGPADAEARVTIPTLPVPTAGDAAARERLLSLGLSGARIAVLGPGAIFGPAKRWPVDNFAAVGRRLAARGMACLVCGTAAEREVCDQVAFGIGGGALSLAGQTSLPELAALCARAEVAVCNDSGLAHLAAAVGARTVVVFGSTSSAWTAPLGPRVRVVQRAPVCAPCFQRTCRVGYRCLTAVGADDVLRACDELGARAA